MSRDGRTVRRWPGLKSLSRIRRTDGRSALAVLGASHTGKEGMAGYCKQDAGAMLDHGEYRGSINL